MIICHFCVSNAKDNANGLLVFKYSARKGFLVVGCNGTILGLRNNKILTTLSYVITKTE
jgi:hypothetical protein